MIFIYNSHNHRFIFIIIQVYKTMTMQSSIQTLEQIAQIACYSVDYQKKVQAQNYFVQVTKNLSPQIIIQIFRNGSDTLIFVSIEYANKFIEQFPQQFLKQIFNAVQGQVSSWYEPNSHQFRKIDFKHNNNNMRPKQITKYVMNSISLFISNCLKRFYIQQTFQKRSQIVNWIGQKTNQRYRLWLYKLFINIISQIDTSMGFIKFRTLSYNFQEEVVPLIAKSLIPFLYRVQQIMKVNQLSLLQQNLNVQQNGIIKNGSKKQNVFINQNEFKFAQLIFDTLHSLVFYNFHLTYTEYEQQSNFQNCLICFPQEFTSKVVTEEFINSIGYVIQRLIDIMPKSRFLKTTLECLQKIFLTKLSYVDQEKKNNYIRQCTIMLTKILSKDNLDQYILTKIMVCNNKFVTNVQINYLKQKQPLKKAFHQWLSAVTKSTFLVLENIQLAEQFNFNIEESLIIECLQLYQKIVASICSISFYSFQQNNKSEVEQKQFIRKNVQSITQIIIKKLLLDESRPLIQGSTAEIFKSNILEIKTFCSCFFLPFKQLASLNYGFLFTDIQKNMMYTLQSSTTSVKFNLIMLLTQVMDRNFLQRNLIMIKASDQEVFILSKCINMMLKFLQRYMASKSSMVINQQVMLLDMAILIFFDKVLSQFLGCFQNHQHIIQIKHRIFQNMIKLQNQAPASKLSQQFILFCIQSVLSYLLIYNKIQQSKHINDFIFETINRILMKFKWGIKRQIFKSSPIYFKLSQFFNQVSKQTNIQVLQLNGFPLNMSLFNQFHRLKWRKKLLKVIALLYFDDVIDDYRVNLEHIFSNLKNQHILTMLLDIEGIGQAIDTTSIFKTYLQMIEKYFSIQRLTNELVHFASSFSNVYDKTSKKYPKIAIIKQIIKMHKSILSNKGQRITSPRNLQSIYYIVKDLIGYWIDFLKISENQQWMPVIKQIISIVTQLIKCDKINFYLVQRICGHEYVIFFRDLFGKMINMVDNVEEHPKLYEEFLNNLVNVSRQLLDVIFFPTIKLKTLQLQDKNKQISKHFIQLVFMIFKKAPVYLQQIKIGNIKNQHYLQKSLQIIKYTLSFINFKNRQCLTHKPQMNDIRLYVQQMKQLVFQNEKLILDYLITQKHFSIHKRILIIIIYEGAIMYPELLPVLVGEMNLPPYLFNEIKFCIESVEREEQQLFIDKFKTWLKMINMTEQEVKKNKQEQIDIYGFMSII